MQARRLCVVIVNYRSANLALDCVESLRAQLDPVRDRVVIIDNNSGAGDMEFLSREIAERELGKLVHLIVSKKNNGFSAGNNIGIRAVKAQYYLLANADTVFRDSSISELVDAARTFSQAGIISPRLEWPDGEPQVSCFRYHSPLSELIHSAGTGIITRVLKKYDVPIDVIGDISCPDWTSFACVLIKKEVFEQVGYLDEEYFMYFEDVDFCRRAREAGFQVINDPVAHVVHLRGQSSGIKKIEKEKERLPDYWYRSRSRYYIKFYTTPGYWLANFCWYIGWSISLLRSFHRRRTLPKFQFIDIWKH